MKTCRVLQCVLLPGLLLLVALPHETYCSWSAEALAFLQELIAEKQEQSSAPAQTKPSPLLLIPGLTGSQLEVNNQNIASGCWTPNFQQLWHPIWITLRAKDHGKIHSIEYLDSYDTLPVLHPLINRLVTDHHYERDVSIRGALYDWRLAPDHLGDYYKEVKAIIEKMYEKNGQRRVTVFCGSLGCPTIHYFFTRLSKELEIDKTWKDKYIHAYMPVVGAWDGGVLALEGLISGTLPMLDKLGPLEPLFAKKISPLMGSFESIYTLLPKPSIWGDTVLVETPNRTYSAKQYEELFNDLGMPDAYKKFKAVEKMNPDFPEPDVRTICVYGEGVCTPKKLVYLADFNKTPPLEAHPRVVTGDGDGVVNLRNSQICLKWESMNTKSKPNMFKAVTCEGYPHIKGCGEVELKALVDTLYN